MVQIWYFGRVLAAMDTSDSKQTLALIQSARATPMPHLL
jgi:hypothetical protein